MPSWILPGRKNAPTMRYRAILGKSFAFSRTFNPRNLEYQWYPLWNQTLSDLISEFPNVIVAPQFPVWFVPQNDEEVEDDEDNDTGNDPDELVVTIGGSHRAESAIVEDYEDHDDALADASFASTLPEKYAKSVVVDFALINLRGVPLKKQKIRYGGWRITKADIDLLVEVKRFVSRGLVGTEFEKELQNRIIEAHEDLINQAAHLFLQDEGKDSVLAIAAAGPYWCNTKIHRKDVMSSMRLLQESDPTYQTGVNSSIKEVRLKWSSLLRLDLARSNERLHTIYKDLVESGVMQTPEDV